MIRRRALAFVVGLIALGAFPASALAAFGFEPGPAGFRSVSLTSDEPKPEVGTLAGSHPYQTVTEFNLNMGGETGGIPYTDGDLRTLEIDLPPGYVENPRRCTNAPRPNSTRRGFRPTGRPSRGRTATSRARSAPSRSVATSRAARQGPLASSTSSPRQERLGDRLQPLRRADRADAAAARNRIPIRRHPQPARLPPAVRHLRAPARHLGDPVVGRARRPAGRLPQRGRSALLRGQMQRRSR